MQACGLNLTAEATRSNSKKTCSVNGVMEGTLIVYFANKIINMNPLCTHLLVNYKKEQKQQFYICKYNV